MHRSDRSWNAPADHLHVKGVRHLDGVPGLHEARAEALPIKCRFHPDRDGTRQGAESREHGVDRGRQLSDLGERGARYIGGTGGDVALMKIESNECYDCLPQGFR